jgi:hypothetical protein
MSIVVNFKPVIDEDLQVKDGLVLKYVRSLSGLPRHDTVVCPKTFVRGSFDRVV